MPHDAVNDEGGSTGAGRGRRHDDELAELRRSVSAALHRASTVDSLAAVVEEQLERIGRACAAAWFSFRDEHGATWSWHEGASFDRQAVGRFAEAVRGLSRLDGPASTVASGGEVVLVAPAGDDVDAVLCAAFASRAPIGAELVVFMEEIAGQLARQFLRVRAQDALSSRLDVQDLVAQVASLAMAVEPDGGDGICRLLEHSAEFFELDAAALFDRADDGYRLRCEIGARGTFQVVRQVAPGDVEFLVSAGWLLTPLGASPVASPASPAPDGATVLSLPLGSSADSVLALVRRSSRPWSDADIDAARAVAVLLHLTDVRIGAQRVVTDRLALRDLVVSFADIGLGAAPGRSEDAVTRMLSTAVEHFDLAGASVWDVHDDRFVCRVSMLAGGEIRHTTRRIPTSAPDGLDFDRVVRQGRVFATVFEDLLDLLVGEATFGEAKVLIVPFGWRGEARGVVTFAERQPRWWTDDEVEAAEALGRVVGQLTTRDVAERALQDQLDLDELLASGAAELLASTADAGDEVVSGFVEKLRDMLGAERAAVWVVDRSAGTMKVCGGLGSGPDDGAGSSAVGTRWLDAVLESAEPQVVAASAVPGVMAGSGQVLVAPADVDGETLVLVVGCRAGGRLTDARRTAVAAAVRLVSQARRRWAAEIESQWRHEAESALAEVAAELIDWSIGGVDEAVHAVLERMAPLIGASRLAFWDRDGVGGDVRRVHLWTRERDGADSGESSTTVVPIGDGASLVAALDSAPVDASRLTAVLETLASVIHEFRRRWAAEEAVARSRRDEQLLGEVATALLAVGPSDDVVDVLGDQLTRLAAEVSADHLSLWRHDRSRDASSEDVLWVLGESHTGPTDRVPPAMRHQRVAADELGVDRLGDGIGQGRIEAMAAPVRALAYSQGLGAGGWAALVGRVSGAESTFLLALRGALDPFSAGAAGLLESAASLLELHHARLSAERYFAQAFREAPIGITLRDADERLLAANTRYLEFTGRSLEELIGTSPEFVLADDVDVDVVEAGRGVEGVELAYRRPGGAVVWGRLKTSPVTIVGQPESVLLSHVEDVTDQRRQRELLEYQALHDDLTGLPNRRAFVATVAEEVSRGGEVAVLVLDLDRFKVVNDSLGHTVGDELLVACADRIRLSLRPGDVLCRLGGDEFAILLRNPTGPAEAVAVAGRLQYLLRSPVKVASEEFCPTASIGVAMPSDGDDVEDVLRHADAAMYQAKARGRDRFEVFDESLRVVVGDRVRTERALRRAIDGDELEVFFQPEVMLDTGRVVGVEALARWHHPDRGLLAAGAFIPLAEETGLVIRLGQFVLDSALRQAVKWRRAGFELITRVNLSARQLRPAVVAEVEQALSAAGLPASMLCLELTETAVMSDLAESERLLGRLHRLGVQIAIDDFGTGLSSLAYLKRFPVDILKIDRTFVDGLGRDSDDTSIVSSIVGLARTLRLEVVAEGIESGAQIEELLALGCRRGQGFHLARPAPAGDVEEFLRACAGGPPAANR